MASSKSISKVRLWTSYILQGIVVLMFLMGAFNNIMQSEMAVSGAMEFGYSRESVFTMGIILLVATLLYAIPMTCFLGALLLTAWLGGAVATHMIHGDPLSTILFPMAFGAIVWLSLILRNRRIQDLFLNSK